MKLEYKYTKKILNLISDNILKKIGFIGVENKPQTMGVASIYVASK